MNTKVSGRKAAHAAHGNTLLVAFQEALERLLEEMGLNRYAFRNQQAFRRKLMANQPDCPISSVYVFVPVGNLPRVNMDSKIQG